MQFCFIVTQLTLLTSARCSIIKSIAGPKKSSPVFHFHVPQGGARMWVGKRGSMIHASGLPRPREMMTHSSIEDPMMLMKWSSFVFLFSLDSALLLGKPSWQHYHLSCSQQQHFIWNKNMKMTPGALTAKKNPCLHPCKGLTLKK